MQSVIYFPGFEPQRRDWLKFALLYLDDLKPIIPQSAEGELSEEFREIMTETDLVHPVRPEEDSSRQLVQRASHDAIDQVERILRHPDRYSHLFGSWNPKEHWRNAKLQYHELWNQKMLDIWADFCLQNQFGQISPNGIKIPRSLASIYMTILANCIGDSQGIAPISDERKMVNYSFFARQPSPNNLSADIKVLETSFPIVLPQNLEDVELRAVVDLRKSTGFSKKRRAFQSAVQRVAESIERGDDNTHLRDELGTSFKDFSDDIARLGTGLVSIAFGMWLGASGADFNMLEGVRQLLTGTAFAVGGVTTIRNSWEHTRTNRLARRYLLEVEQLHNRLG